MEAFTLPEIADQMEYWMMGFKFAMQTVIIPVMGLKMVLRMRGYSGRLL